MSVFGFPGFHENLVDVGAPKRPLEEDEEFQTLMRQRTNYRPEGYRPPDTLNREIFEAIERGNVLEEHAGRLIADHNALDAEHERLRQAHGFLQMKHEYVGVRHEPEETWFYKVFYDAIVNDNAYNVTLLLTIQDPPLRNALLNHRWYEDEVDVEWPGDLDLFTDVGDESDKFWTPVGVAVCRGSETVLHILIEAGANISTYNDLAFRAAVYLGNLAMVGLLLDAGAENSEDSLIEPAYNGNDEMVALLIARSNANVHVDNDWPLRLAARKGHDVVVARLIAAEANVRAKDDQALRKAAKNGYDAVVALLIAAKANVRAKDDQALLEAAENGHEAVVALLIEAYSDIDAIKKAEHFKKALDLAAENGHDAVVARLIAAKANVHGRHGAIFLTKPP
jgi:hypothetical protein